MVEFELKGVYGGWEQANFGPADQIDYVLHTDTGRAESYDSLHSFLKLYDLTRIEEPRHPNFLGYEVRDFGPSPEIEVEIHGRRAKTTYDELQSALEPFLTEVFRALDEETVGDVREEHLQSLDEADETLVDVSELYERLVEN